MSNTKPFSTSWRATMPKYTYQCNMCKDTWSEWHSMSEEPLGCPCGSTSLTRIPNNFITINQTISPSKKKVGEATVDGIEENREILKQMKEIARNKEFDPNA